MTNRLIEERGSFATELDREYLNQARQLARLGAGRTGSNPMVGALVVHANRVVASGHHGARGNDHAEVVALDAAGDVAGTLYVTLEPCAHQGRTPPCIDRIIDSAVTRVVCPSIDPDTRVRGRGIAALQAAGVNVDVGCMAEPAILDNLGFYRNRLGFSSTVTLKMAVSQDGMVARARGRRDDVTSAESRADVHVLRATHDAVVIGIETLLIDNPRLDCRLLPNGCERVPVPVVLDTHARTPLDNLWLREKRDFVVVCANGADAARVDALARAGARIVRVRPVDGRLDIRDVVRALEALSLPRILVEGGPRVVRSFIASGEWDALWVYRSPQEFGENGVPLFASAHEANPGRVVDEITIGEDRRLGMVNESRWSQTLAALAAARS